MLFIVLFCWWLVLFWVCLFLIFVFFRSWVCIVVLLVSWLVLMFVLRGNSSVWGFMLCMFLVKKVDWWVVVNLGCFWFFLESLLIYDEDDCFWDILLGLVGWIGKGGGIGLFEWLINFLYVDLFFLIIVCFLLVKWLFFLLVKVVVFFKILLIVFVEIVLILLCLCCMVGKSLFILFCCGFFIWVIIFLNMVLEVLGFLVLSLFNKECFEFILFWELVEIEIFFVLDFGGKVFFDLSVCFFFNLGFGGKLW